MVLLNRYILINSFAVLKGLMRWVNRVSWIINEYTKQRRKFITTSDITDPAFEKNLKQIYTYYVRKVRLAYLSESNIFKIKFLFK